MNIQVDVLLYLFTFVSEHWVTFTPVASHGWISKFISRNNIKTYFSDESWIEEIEQSEEQDIR